MRRVSDRELEAINEERRCGDGMHLHFWTDTGRATSACAYDVALDLQDVRELLAEYESWEADVILTGDWSGDTVRLTQEQHDRLSEIAIRRNRLLGRVAEDGGVREALDE